MFKIERISGATGRVTDTRYATAEDVSTTKAEMRQESRQNPPMSSDTIRVSGHWPKEPPEGGFPFAPV